jgi:ppGpp synthetase/RelA/SpoT-type nucleotidyltranferase
VINKLTHLVDVPAKAVDVKAFLAEHRDRLIADMRTIRRLIGTEREDLRMASVYKIYSRGDLQPNNDELKHPRKVRLKSDDFHRKKGAGPVSLFDLPDIVGFTIVVSFPSDITRVASLIDDLIDQRKFRKATLGGVITGATPAAAKRIVTRHGRAIESDGYFACHYNVSTNGVGRARPIVEIQIKTVLHDAWGLKTHDLTYKTTGHTDLSLLISFSLLGDMLANVDLQSDTLRDSINRSAAVREAKRARLQWELLHAPVQAAVSRLEAAGDPCAPDLRAILEAIEDNGSTWTPAESEARQQLLQETFETLPYETCQVWCLLAARSKLGNDSQSAREAITEWEQRSTDELDQLWARSTAALAAFAAGEASEAIDIAEEAAAAALKFDATSATSSQLERLARLSNALFSSLSYYHADRIGSHEGRTRDSRSQALDWLARARTIAPSLGLPQEGIDSDRKVIDVALADPARAGRTFATLDNEAFVLIQTADSEGELRRVRDLLQFLHDKKPPGSDPAASLLFDFHDYCARMRLAELEAG